MIEYLREKQLWLVSVAVITVAGFYAPGFTGFWHGDDFPNLHRAYALTQQATLWPDTFRLFIEAVPSEGAFYRPMMMLSLALNHVLADAHYGGWYFVNFSVHLFNTLLVALVVRRLAKHYGCDATFSAPFAALLFGLCPTVAEGVYWMSARADGWVTLLSLAGVYAWAGPAASALSAASASSRSPFALPLLLIVALGFKESAAVVPLQLTLVAMVWQGRLSRSQRWALFATFVVAGLFMAWRAFLFGNAWQVYTPVATGSVALPAKFWGALLSFGPWWAALGQATPLLATAYLACFTAGIVLFAFAGPVPTWRLALALAAASGGLALATLLNLGAMSSLGEGGRLSYGPVAWLALAVGVFVSRPQSLHNQPISRPLVTSAASVAVAFALLTGTGVLWGHLRAAWTAQASMRNIALAVAPWADNHPGLTMLMVPDHDGAIVMARNAQGGLVLEPIQKQPYLHLVLPTLTSEIQLRQEQFSRGLARRLEIVRPRLVDAGTLMAILDPAEAGWPKHVACWSKSQQKIIPLPTPPMDASAEAWLASIRIDIENCGR